MSATLFGFVKFTNLPGTKRAIMWVLADHASDQGVCWPNRATLAREVGITENPLRTNLQELERDGWLKMEVGNGRGKPTKYQLNVRKLRSEATLFDEAFPVEEVEKGTSKKDPFSSGSEEKRVPLPVLKGTTSSAKGYHLVSNKPLEPSMNPYSLGCHHPLTDEQVQKLKTRWSMLSDIDARIDEALAHKSAKGWENKYLGVNNWLRNAAERYSYSPTSMNGRPQAVTVTAQPGVSTTGRDWSTRRG